jgi:hypothetical protein
MELKIAQREAARLQKMIKEQVAILSKLEEEIGELHLSPPTSLERRLTECLALYPCCPLAVFRSAFNERVLFFAQYQAISDSVRWYLIPLMRGSQIKLTFSFRSSGRRARRQERSRPYTEARSWSRFVSSSARLASKSYQLTLSSSIRSHDGF